jgi:hypothetical protein
MKSDTELQRDVAAELNWDSSIRNEDTRPNVPSSG